MGLPKCGGLLAITGAACAPYRWANAAGSLAAQRALAEQGRERRWQKGAHPGWGPGRKLAVLSRGPLADHLGTG